jgi:hypothetical protein
MLPSLCCGDRKFVRIVLAVLVFSIFATLASAQTDTWTGITGNWSDPTHWSNGVPVTGDNIVINTASAISTDDFSLAIGQLTLENSNDFLDIKDGVALNVSSTIANQGIIGLRSAGTNTYLLITGSQSLSGTGLTYLDYTGPNYITGASGSGTEVLTNANTIEGVGNIGNGAMGLVNNGQITADNGAGSLFIDVSSAGLNNTGTLEAISGNLTIQGPANSFLNYNATTNTLTGGTYIATFGSIYFPASSSGITTLSARATQEGGGQIINSTTGTNAFANLARITSKGALATQVGFTQPGAFSMAGALNILPNTEVKVGSVTQIQNNVLTGGQWVLDSNLNITGPAAQIVTNSATVTLSGGTFKNAGGSDAFSFLEYNTKVLRIMNFAKLSPANTVVNTGQVTIAQGCKLTFSSGFGYQQNSGKTTNDGTIVNGVQIDGGTYLGAGRVAGDLGIGGTSGTGATFSVGDAGKGGLAQVTGNYLQWPNGILSTGIGGTTVGTQYSQLKAGHATLAGTLAATLLNGFTPTVGETFTVLMASPVSGTFTNTTIPINSTEHFAISYTTTKVILTVVSGPAAE